MEILPNLILCCCGKISQLHILCFAPVVQWTEHAPPKGKM